MNQKSWKILSWLDHLLDPDHEEPLPLTKNEIHEIDRWLQSPLGNRFVVTLSRKHQSLVASAIMSGADAQADPIQSKALVSIAWGFSLVLKMVDQIHDIATRR